MLNVLGEVRVFRNDFKVKGGTRTSYSITIGKKVENEWENMFINVQFKKDLEADDNISNGDVIQILESFMTFYDSKEGKKVKLVITDFDFKEDEEEEEKEVKKKPTKQKRGF